jgi:hypothetical protein
LVLDTQALTHADAPLAFTAESGFIARRISLKVHSSMATLYPSSCHGVDGKDHQIIQRSSGTGHLHRAKRRSFVYRILGQIHSTVAHGIRDRDL